MSEHQVVSPLPGIFYRSSAPGQPPMAAEGATVTADQSIGLVEIMKQFTEVKAGAAGTLIAFRVENESPVSPGETIATVDTGAT